jgi:hypothetical protein
MCPEVKSLHFYLSRNFSYYSLLNEKIIIITTFLFNHLFYWERIYTFFALKLCYKEISINLINITHTHYINN